jgi:tetratricopeptide (TPR) repeat protein
MIHRRLLALVLSPLLVCLLLCEATAQIKTGNVHIYITYPDDRAATGQLKVGLIGESSNQVKETYTNDHGQAQFDGLEIGTYRVVISGDGIQTAESDSFEVDARQATQSIFVRVRPTSEIGETTRSAPGASTISASDLRVPENASKEFDKATQLIAKEQWQKAIERLNKALALYPAYAQAYNNLGVIYARLGDSDNERAALQKAIEVDSHFAPAFVNLARMEMKEHSFIAAESHLKQATAAHPEDVRTLALLTQVQLLNAHFEDAIANARKVHSMSHESYAMVHYVAARACERMNRLADAIVEFKLFLSEEPSGDIQQQSLLP